MSPILPFGTIVVVFAIAFAISSAQGKSPAQSAQVAGISVAVVVGVLLLLAVLGR